MMSYNIYGGGWMGLIDAFKIANFNFDMME